ncbi:MAG: transposase [Planctomycetota bacterium]|jgi:putative transposase
MPSRRPHDNPLDRMAILELRARRGWSVADTADGFLVEPKTVASWMRRLDEPVERPLVQTVVPVNKYPDVVGYIVRRLRTLCPTMGKRKIAEVLARAGLHLGSTTVQRMSRCVGPGDDKGASALRRRQVVAKAPNHVWSLDLTVVPMQAGFWTMLKPFTWLRRWPFCWWVAVVVDRYSRRAVGFAVFRKLRDAHDVTVLMRRAVAAAGATPRHIPTDRGKQFDCREFKRWCQRRGIRPRYGAVGRPGSIALVERFIRSFKDEATRRLMMPMSVRAVRRELVLYAYWFNHYRPHQGLGGRTPDEVHFHRRPANQRPRYEPRAGWPRSGGCAAPRAAVRGRSGTAHRLTVSSLAGQFMSAPDSPRSSSEGQPRAVGSGNEPSVRADRRNRPRGLRFLSAGWSRPGVRAVTRTRRTIP